MDTNDIIFIPTIQHTGTWFLLRYLERFIPTVREASLILDKNKPISEKMIIHCHFPINQGIAEDKKGLAINTILMMANIFKTVIPLRDPLAAILTREVRHPELRHFYIVDGFKQVAENFNDHPNVKFFPVDLPCNEEQRRSLLIDTMVHCGIDPNPHHDIICDTAHHWLPENNTPKNYYKGLYSNKDIHNIRLMLGPKWAEVVYLKHSAGVIHPLLTGAGYTKEDLDLW